MGSVVQLLGALLVVAGGVMLVGPWAAVVGGVVLVVVPEVGALVAARRAQVATRPAGGGS